MNWKKFPNPDKAFSYPGAALQKNWARLHRGDCEPFPADPKVQAAWRSYHGGDFGQAVAQGLACGLAGYAAASKAAIVYASYLESDDDRQLTLLLDAAKRCEELQQALPQQANAWYLQAYALGRYSQRISIVKALTEGLGNKIKNSLAQAIALEPKHADAHIALGAYHAEVIDKVGSLVGGLTYGARKAAGVEHFETALKLNPDSAIARIEYANGLVMMFGNARVKEAEGYYQEAAACTAADAMEWLDIESARAELED
jgi:tetratricopeptide (TPR) repeat protein